MKACDSVGSTILCGGRGSLNALVCMQHALNGKLVLPAGLILLISSSNSYRTHMD